jgi:hypothetical protein
MLILLGVLLVVLVAGAIGIPRLLRSPDEPSSAGSPATTAAPAEPQPGEPQPTGSEPIGTTAPEPTGEGSTDEPPPAPTAVGIVRIGAGLTDDRAAEVATMFDTYFAGINAKDYDQVGSVLDPAGSIDPTDAGAMAELADGTRTTRDTGIALNRLLDLGGDRVRAEVTFRSTQKAGDGPRGRTGETCTRWDIAYTLSTPPYRILRSTASSRPC